MPSRPFGGAAMYVVVLVAFVGWPAWFFLDLTYNINMISNKDLAKWFATSGKLIQILEEFNDKNEQLNMASEAGRLLLAEFIIEKIKDK